jgi:PAS domain S-box-containing protein
MKDNRNKAIGADPDSSVARAVHRAKLELEQMIDLAPQVMLLVDEQGFITRANVALLRFLGTMEFQKVLGRRLSDCFDVAEEGFFGGLLAIEGGYGMREAAASTKGGRSGVFRFTVVGIGEEARSHVLIVEDITRQKEQAVRDEKEHKKDAVRALAGGLMHRINQRLTVITVRSRLMLMALEKDDVRGDELKKGLHDIMALTMEIAGILDKLGDQKDYVTESYLEGLEILDLERSSGKGQGAC